MKTTTKMAIVAVAFLLVVVLIIAAGSSVNNTTDQTSNSQSNSGQSNGGSSNGGAPDTTSDSNASSSSVSTTGTPQIAATNATVYFISVGQGDSELIRTQDNKTILIDTGPSSGQSAEISFLSSHTYGTIDDLVLTHPDADHIGNAVAVLNSFTVKAVYQSGCPTNTATYTKLESKLNSMAIPEYTNAQVHPGDMMNWSSSVSFEVMAINAQAADTNDASIVLKMVDGTVSYLFEGDASSAVEQQMDSEFGSAMDVDILKVGHHGSSSDSSMSFLTDTSPAVAVIEVGAGNDYGLPTQQTLDRLSGDGAQVYRTDQEGTVTVTTDGSTWAVYTTY